MRPERIIIDCDPGVDDCLALLLAMASPDEIEIVGITTVAGNVPLDVTTNNALKICQLAGQMKLPVFAGCQGAMFPVTRHVLSSHGQDGLGGVELGDVRKRPQSQHAIDFIIDTVTQNPGEITLCVIGPMTNIALALLKEPSLARSIKRLIFMGGAAFCPGNITPAAEFNIWIDPHSAQIVLRSGVPMTMLGLDVTNTAEMTLEWLDHFRRSLAHVGTALADMMANYGRGDPCLHDPCVIAYLLNPSLFSGVKALVEIDCESNLNRGRSVAATLEHLTGDREANCTVVTEVDSARLFQMITDKIARYWTSEAA